MKYTNAAACLLLLGVCAVVLHAQDRVATDKPGPASAGAPSGQEALKFPCTELAKLDAFTGPWNVVETHFDSLGQPIATVKGTEVISWQLDQHALRRTYATGADEPRFRAVGLVTWNRTGGHYVAHWFDNRSLNGPAQGKGEWQEESRSLVFTLEAVAADGTKAHYKIIERWEDNDHRVATTYQVSGKDLTKRLEVRYERSAPCPSGSQMRVISYPDSE